MPRQFRSQTSDSMGRWKAEVERVREEKSREEKKEYQRKIQKKEDAGAQKGRKVVKHYVFPMICGSGGSKNRLAKAAGAEPSGHMRYEKLHAVVARSTFRNQEFWRSSDHFWKLRCPKSACRCGAKHIAKSKCTKHSILGPLLEVEEMLKSAPRCGAKHIAKSKCTKHSILGLRLEGEMLKKCTLLWREAHFKVKMYRTQHSRNTFWS